MGLRGEVEDCVDVVVFDAAHDIFDVRDVAVRELEVRRAVETVRIVECRAVVDLVEGDYSVGWVLER